MKLKQLYRTLPLSREAVDVDARTVEIAFSSEEPVERFFGDEVLDHDPKSVRMERMNDGAAVLLQHDHDKQIGVVESAKIDGKDRTGRALVRFGKSALASEIFDDVNDGIRRHISVGYRIHEIREKTKENLVRVTDWEPYEVSFVSVPADATVGVGREADGEPREVAIIADKEDTKVSEDTKPDEGNSLQLEPAGPSDEDKARWREQAGKAERERVASIHKLGRKWDLEAEAEKAIDANVSVDKFRELVLDSQETKRSKPAGQDYTNPDQYEGYIDLSDQEAERYSFVAMARAIHAGDRTKAGFEREVSEAIAKNLGRETDGFLVPWNVFGREKQSRKWLYRHMRHMMHRAPPMDTGTAGEGAELVGTDHRDDLFIEYLYTTSVVMEAGATMLPGLVGNVDIPKQSGTATFEWLAEGASVTDSVVGTANVPLSPRTISGSVPMTRRLLKQSAPSVDAMVQRDLIVGAGLGIDKGALVGAGGNEPTGIINQAGVGTVEVGTSGAPSYAEYVALETAVATDDADIGAMRYILDAGHIGNAKTTFIDAGSGLRIMNPGSTQINGYETSRTNSMTSSTGAQFDGVVFGVFTQVLVGMWGVLDVRRDPYTLAASDGLHIRVFQDVDIAVRHGQSFAKTINAV